MAERVLRRFLAVRYTGGNKTAMVGKPDTTTGRFSIAIEDRAFQSRNARDEWVAGGYLREAITKKKLRQLLAGLNDEDFESHYFYLASWPHAVLHPWKSCSDGHTISFMAISSSA